MRHKTVITLALLGTVACSSGCARTVLIPKIGFDHIVVRPHFAEPVFAGPGSIGPIFSMPRIVTPCKSCGPCGNSCSSCDPCNSYGPCGDLAGAPLQPIDPFVWLRGGSMSTQEIDPGWLGFRAVAVAVGQAPSDEVQSKRTATPSFHEPLHASRFRQSGPNLQGIPGGAARRMTSY